MNTTRKKSPYYKSPARTSKRKEQKVHLSTPSNRAACSVSSYTLKITHNLSEVTCKNCRNIK